MCNHILWIHSNCARHHIRTHDNRGVLQPRWYKIWPQHVSIFKNRHNMFSVTHMWVLKKIKNKNTLLEPLRCCIMGVRSGPTDHVLGNVSYLAVPLLPTTSLWALAGWSEQTAAGCVFMLFDSTASCKKKKGTKRFSTADKQKSGFEQ